MPRKPRKISNTGIYHIVCRGNNKNDIFLDDDDNQYFIDILLKIKNEYKFLIFAYCMMKNHFHLLINLKENSISRIMQKINLIYVSYFNRKYQKIGHLFQNRFKSEPVENDDYLITATRYIHNNPVKAKIVKKAEDYKWSSYNEYLGTGTRSPCPLTDTNFIMVFFSYNINNFIEFSLENNNDDFIDLKNAKIFEISTLKEANLFTSDFLNKYGIDLKSIKLINNADIRNKLIKELKKKSSLSIISISNLLGVGTKNIRRAR